MIHIVSRAKKTSQNVIPYATLLAAVSTLLITYPYDVVELLPPACITPLHCINLPNLYQIFFVWIVYTAKIIQVAELQWFDSAGSVASAMVSIWFLPPGFHCPPIRSSCIFLMSCSVCLHSKHISKLRYQNVARLSFCALAPIKFKLNHLLTIEPLSLNL